MPSFFCHPRNYTKQETIRMSWQALQCHWSLIKQLLAVTIGEGSVCLAVYCLLIKLLLHSFQDVLLCFVALIKCAAVLIFFLSITLFAFPCTYICTLAKTNTYNTDCCTEATPETVSLWLQILNESSGRLMDLHPFHPLPSFCCCI